MTSFKKLSIGILSAVFALSVAVHTSHAGPSAKFAFSTSDLTLIEQTSGTAGWVTVLSSSIKTPASKELFVSGSLETGLYTQTLVKSKNNKKDTSTASVGIQVRALIDGQAAPPGVVTYDARTQTLSATLEGAIAGCLTQATNADGSTSIILDEDCVTPEEIELILSTLSASTFHFVASNVPVGDHVISLQARITSSTSVQEGSATAEALVGKGTMIVETVRAVGGHAASGTGAEEGAPAADAGSAPATAQRGTWGKLKTIYR